MAVKVAIRGDSFTYAGLAAELFLSASEVHGSLARAKLAGLVSDGEREGLQVIKASLREFIVYGARYAFPPIQGSLARGMPTAYAAPAFSDQISLPDEPPPVWPHHKGSIRGIALCPLYPSVPRAAELDPALYNVLTLFDAIRIGAARERKVALSLLNRILA